MDLQWWIFNMEENKLDEEFWAGKELPEDWWNCPEILEKLFNEMMARDKIKEDFNDEETE